MQNARNPIFPLRSWVAIADGRLFIPLCIWSVLASGRAYSILLCALIQSEYYADQRTDSDLLSRSHRDIPGETGGDEASAMGDQL